MKTDAISRMLRYLASMTIVLGLGISSVQAYTNPPGEKTIKVNKRYKIKKSSDGSVSLYTFNESGEREEYSFTEFNADVLLMVYRGAEMEMIIKNLSKKYFITKTDARRYVKMTINELDERDLIVRN